MRSNFFSVVASAAVAVLLTASCASKPKTTDAGDGANATGNAAPAISNEAITTDPMGSDSGKINGLSTIFFDYDKANLSKDAQKKLAQNVGRCVLYSLTISMITEHHHLVNQLSRNNCIDVPNRNHLVLD